MKPESLRQLLKERESESLEFKRAIPPLPSLAQDLAAFANCRGGVLLLGVEEGDPNRLVGVDVTHANRLLKRAAETLSPSPRLVISATNLDGKDIVSVRVEATQGLTFAPNGIFIRRGDQVRPFTGAEAVQAVSKLKAQDPAVAAKLADSLARLTEQLDAQAPLLEDLRKANSWPRKIMWIAVGALAGGFAKELLPMVFA